MKILIIGLDALEYELVVKLNLKALMQKQYGKLFIPGELHHPEAKDIPYTPLVWGTLLTGKNPKEHKAKSIWVYRNKILEKIRWIPPFKWVKSKKKFLKLLGIEPKMTVFRIKTITIFDQCNPSIAVNVPGINWWDDWVGRISSLQRAGEFEEAINLAFRYASEVFTSFEQKVRHISNYRLAMVYTNLLDTLGHLCWYKCKEKLIRGYKLVNLKVPRIIKYAKPDIIVVISDHGMKGSSDGVTGTHSNYMFWSINIDYKFKNIYEIPQKVIQWCNK